MKIAIETENGIEEFNFQNILKGIWDEIIKIPCEEKFPNTTLPKIRFRKGYRKGLGGFAILGCTRMKSPNQKIPEIEMYMQNKGIFRLDAFIHECIHARGFHHNPLIGFVTEIENDKITARICENLGLIGKTRIKVLRKFRKSNYEKYL